MSALDRLKTQKKSLNDLSGDLPIQRALHQATPLQSTLIPQAGVLMREKQAQQQAMKTEEARRKGVLGTVSEFVAPTRGFTDKEVSQARPTLREGIVGAGRWTAELAGGIAGIGELVGDVQEKYLGARSFGATPRSLQGEPRLSEKFAKLAQPKTVEEAAAMRAVDVVSFLPAGVIRTAQGTAQALTKVDDVAKVTKELKSIGIREADDVAETIAKSTNEQEILEIILKKQSSKTPDLLQEAKKYKSAEEFVKAQGTPVYHGTDADFSEFDLKKVGTQKYADWGDGIYFDPRKEGADYYRREAIYKNNPNVIKAKEEFESLVKKYKTNSMDYSIDLGYKSPKYLEVDKARMKWANAVDEAKEDATKGRVIEAYIDPVAKVKKHYLNSNTPDPTLGRGARAEGYDVLEIYTGGVKDEVVVLNPKVLKTRSQLTDIWNKAQETPKQKATPRVATPTEVRALAGKTRLKEEVLADIDVKKQEVDQLQLQKAFIEDNINNSPAAALARLIPKKEYDRFGYGDGTIDLMEVHLRRLDQKKQLEDLSKTRNLNGVERRQLEALRKSPLASLDAYAQDLGYNNLDEAQDALEAYMRQREAMKLLRTEIKEATASIKPLREERVALNALDRFVTRGMQGRRARINAVQDAFNLTDKEMATIRRGRDPRMMNEVEFTAFIRDLETRGKKEMLASQGRLDVKTTIHELELQKTENLQKAMNLPPLKKMTVAQLQEYNEALSQFKKGDVFLTPRKIEVLQKTDLAGAKTYREAKEMLAKKFGTTLEAMDTIPVHTFYKSLWDRPLARQHPLFAHWINEKTKVFLERNARVVETQKKVNELANKARASRKRSLVDKAIPTDDIVFEWLEAENKTELAKKMTPEELDYALYVRDEYAKMRDYLVKYGEMDKYRENYITHIRKDFLEGVKDGDVLNAFKNIFTEQKADEAAFRILDDKTGEVLNLEKFFRFTMRRSGEIDPTKNVAKAFTRYNTTFQTKVALDSIISELDIYTDILSPQAVTKKGLEKDPRLKEFFNQWMNTQKGRFVSYDSMIPQGSVQDTTLRGIKALTTLVDLGVNVALMFAQPIGELVGNYTMLGAKNLAKGSMRMGTKQGRAIVEKYRNFIGESFVDDVLRSAEKNIADKTVSSLMAQYRLTTNAMNEQYLLGAISDAEFKAGEINVERLAQMKMDMSKWRVTEGQKSVFGSTSLGGAFTQYKTWAFNPLYAWKENVTEMLRIAGTDGRGKAFKSQAAVETYRQIAVIVPVFLYGAHLAAQDDDGSFIMEVQRKMLRDALSSVGALDLNVWSSARTLDFLADISSAIMQILTISEYDGDTVFGERYKSGDKKGTLKGDDALLRTITPSPVRMLTKEENSKGTSLDSLKGDGSALDRLK